MTVLNYNDVKELFTVWRADFMQTYEQFGAQTQWANVATNVPSTSSANEYYWLDAFPSVREWVNDRHIRNLKADAYRVENKKYEVTVEIEKDKVDDGAALFNTSLLFRMQAEAAAKAKDKFVFNKLKAGFTDLAYDGQPFFSTTHEAPNGGTQSNYGGGAGTAWYLLDASKPLKPLIWQSREEPNIEMLVAEEEAKRTGRYQFGGTMRGAPAYTFWQMAYASKQTLDKNNFNAGIAAMMSFQDKEGEYISNMPTVLVVPPSLRDEAMDVVGVPLVNNTTNYNYNIVSVIITPHII